MDPLTIGLIGASLLGPIFSSIGQNRSDRRTNQANLAQQKLVNRHNIQFWQMQNKYNHPVQQMNRLRQAGLNPNLIYGTPSASATGNAESIAPSKAVQQQHSNLLAPFGSIGQDIGNAIQTGTQVANTKANTARTKQQTQHEADLHQGNLDLQEEQKRGAELDNDLKQIEKEIAEMPDYKQIRLNNLIEQNNYLVSQTGLNNSRKALVDFEKEMYDLGITKDSPLYLKAAFAILRQAPKFNEYKAKIGNLIMEKGMGLWDAIKNSGLISIFNPF